MAVKKLKTYSKLTELYPKEFKESYQQPLIATTEDMIEGAKSSKQAKKLLRASYLDLPISIASEHFKVMENILMHKTPLYIKRNGLIAGLLLLPFVAALLANSVDKVLYNHTLYHSWLWSFPYLRLWVVYFPTLALIITGISFVTYLAQERSKQQTSLVKLFFDVRQNWPITLTGALALFVILALFFHDDAFCVVQNPISTLTHLNSTWTCLRTGFLGGHAIR
ncbi:MAG: hypothetical protein ACHQUB_01910 [Candidatus Saccharimonadia bacterium]